MSALRTTSDTEAVGVPQARSAFAGVLTLIRFMLRRERLRVPLWVLGIVGFVVGSATSLVSVIATEAQRQSRAELMATPTLRALRGPGYGLDEYTAGAMVAHELLLLGAIAVAVMTISMVVRHTRGEEESGRAELLRSSPVGIYAFPAAALVVATGASLTVGAMTALALRASIPELATSGAWAFGLSMAMVGIVFAAVAAVVAQVTQHTRGALGIATVALGVAFVLRAVGDTGGVGDRPLSWMSPIGWAQATRPFVDERWWPLALCLGSFALLAAAAFVLADRRDVAAGLVQPRPGPAGASALLVRPTGLAARLHGGGIVAWGAGLILLGASFGAVIGEIEAFLDENPQMEQVIGAAEGGRLLDSFLATVVLILALLATGHAIAGALRLRSEETAGRAEPLLATSLPRIRWAGAHVVTTLIGSAAVLLLGTAGLGAAAALTQGDAALLTDMLLAGVLYLPAVWVGVAATLALFGLVPRASGLVWIVLVHAVVVGLLGDVLDLPGAVRDLSPLHHVPQFPAADAQVAPLLGLSAVAAVLLVAGLAGFHRRGVNQS